MSIPTRPSRFQFAFYLFVYLFASTSWAEDAKAPAGHPIGSAGFNDLLGKQVKSGTFTTEQQTDGSFVLTNKMQTVSAHVTAQGVQFDSIGNSKGKGGFGLQLSQWGREGNLQQAESSKIYRDGDVVFHTLKNGIAEKFSNTNNGIQQDFIIPVKPEGNGSLHVQLQVSGATVKAKDNGASIQLASGRQLTYDRLTVTDSAGKTIPAHITLAQNKVLDVVVDDATAQYPLMIDPTVGDANWVSMGGLPGTDGSIYAMVSDASGNLYIGGTFIIAGSVVANNIAKWNGSVWSALGSGVNGNNIYALAIDSSGNLYAGGYFTTAGGVTVNNIAKWNGSSWSALGSGLGSTVYALAVDSSGNVYAGGYFTTAGGVSAKYIAKWNGVVWSGLGSGMNSPYVFALVLDSSGNLYAGGNFTTAGGVTVNYIAKWNGSAWSALGAGMNGQVKALVVDSNGNLYAGGQFKTASGVAVQNVAKWNGSAWSALGSGVSGGIVNALAVDNGNNLYVGGQFTWAGGVSSANRMAKWNGTAWSLLGSGFSVQVLALAADSHGNVYAGGEFTGTSDGSVTANYIAEWNSSTWSALGSGLNNPVNVLVMDGNGNLYAAMGHTVARWTGSTWSVLGAGMDNRIAALAVDSSGNLYAGGYFRTAGGVSANSIAKWNGSTWSALGSGVDTGWVKALVVDSNDNLYVGGYFTAVSGVAAADVAKWNGSIWSALVSNIDDNFGDAQRDEVDALAVDNNNNLYIGGHFSIVDGVSAIEVAKWNGTAWSALGTGSIVSSALGGDYGYFVNALAVDKNGNVYAASCFYSSLEFGHSQYQNSQISESNGSAWSTLTLLEQDTAAALAVDSSGNLYAGGAYIQGNSPYPVAKWNGSVWSTLGSGVINGQVSALALDSSDNLYAGGSFTVAGGKAAAYVAKWTGGSTSIAPNGLSYVFDYNNSLDPSGTVTASSIAPNGSSYGADESNGVNPNLTHKKNDFSGDGKSGILFFNTATGGTQYWTDAMKSQVVYPGKYDFNYRYAGSGDFDGDGKADALFTRASNNGTVIWNGVSKVGDEAVLSYPGTSTAGFSVAAICDVNGDSKDDILWSNATTGGTQLWPSATKAIATYPGAQGADYSVVACSDFDGDGKADVFWRNNMTGANEIWLSGNKSTKLYPGAYTDLTWGVVGAGDIDADGKSDVVWYKTTTGAIQVWKSGLKSAATYPGANAMIFSPADVGDYDGDGKADLLWVNTTTNATQIWPGLVKASATYPGTYTAGFSEAALSGYHAGLASSAAVQLVAGISHNCLLSQWGQSFCWGADANGELGDNGWNDSGTPLMAGSNLTDIAAGGAHSCAVSAVGGVTCWGYNSNGQLGNGMTVNSYTPVNVTGLSSGISSVTAGLYHSCALTTSGGVDVLGQ